MGVHCINPKSKDFINISKRLNISPANLEDIIHKYLYDNDTDEYPSDDYIKAALEGTRTEMSQSQADLWERDYSLPKKFKTLLELNRAKLIALRFFRKEAISEYIDAEGNYILKVAPPSFEKEYQEILDKAPRDSQGRLLAPNGKPSNLTERQYALVRTKAFKDWFGDWEKLAPKKEFKKTLYRGQSAKPIIDSDGNLVLKATYDDLWKGYGLSFANSEEYAEDYGKRSSHSPYIIKIDQNYLDKILPLVEEAGTKGNNIRSIGDEYNEKDREERLLFEGNIKIPKQYYIIKEPSLSISENTYQAGIDYLQAEDYFSIADELPFSSTKNKWSFNEIKILYNDFIKRFPNETAARAYLYEIEQNIKTIGIIKYEKSFNEYLESEETPYGDIFIKYIGPKPINNVSQSTEVSKVVDENGEPLVVYHGTNIENISIFDRTQIPEEQTLVGTGTATFGNFFSNKKDDAKSFANITRLRRNRGKATVYDTFLSIKNPMYFETLGDFRDYSHKEGHYNENGDFVSDIKLPKEYDGIIVKRRNSRDDAKEFVAPNPNQIKSATDNTGAFSTTNDNIYLEHEYNLENPKKDTRLEELSRKNEVTINDLVLLISLSEYNDIINVLKELSTGKEKLLKDIKVSVINPLDYYSKANEIRSKFNGRRAYYDADTNTIVIDASANFSNGDASSIILHEIMHHITVDRILSNPSLKEEFITLIKEYRKHYPNEYIGAIDNHYIEEFIADIWSNRTTIENLKKVEYKGKKHTTSLWDKILLFFKNKLFKGAVKDSMFELASNLLIDTINTNIKEYSKDTFYDLGVSNADFNNTSNNKNDSQRFANILESELTISSEKTILSNEELKYWNELGVGEMPRILVASERTDPAFHVKDILDIINGEKTVPQWGVVNGRRTVTGNLSGKDFAGLYLITKHDGLPMLKLLLTKIPKLLHFSITTLGGTLWEPGVMKYNDLLNKIEDYIKLGLDPNSVTIRIDPIVPGITKKEDIELVVKRASSMGIKRIRFSIMDAYSNTRIAMTNLGYDFSTYYGKNFFANKEYIEDISNFMLSLADKYDITLGTCAENIAKNGISKEGCLSVAAVNNMLGTNIEDKGTDNNSLRLLCSCYGGKVDALAYAKTCASHCVYCYAKHENDKALLYYNEDGTLKDNVYTRTREELPKLSLEEEKEINPLTITNKTEAYGVTIDGNLIRNYRTWLLNNPNGIVAYRVNRLKFNTPLMVEQGIIGNPFDWLKYGTEVCLKMFYDWLVNGNNYNEPLATELFRLAIINKLLNTQTPNILYYKELNMPSHATVLGYLITNKQLISPTQQSLILPQLLSTLPMVTKIISGGLTGVDTIGLQVARELGIETGGTAPKGFLRESGIDEEDISSYNLTEITDEELADYTKRKGKNDPYTGRTELNVRNSDGTVYFYTSNDELGMRATKRSAEDWGKPFITNPTAELLRQWLIDNNIKTLNVAGNRGSKLDKNNNVAKILREALTNKPKLLKEEKRDPYRERQQEITRLLDALQESSLMTNIEIREIAEQVVYWISDHITELLENPELAVKIYGDTVKNLNTQEASRIEIVNAIGLDNIKEMCKLKFSPKNAGYTKISTIRKANLIIDNWDAIMLLASDVFTEIEKFSITETVVADKVVSLTNENLNNNLDNFNAEEQNDEESLLETHGNLLEHWQTKANTIDIMDSMSLLMHRAIAQCYQLEEVSRDENNKPVYDKVKSEFGINLRVKPREVTGSLLRWCQGCLNIKDVIANLKAKESANPWVSLIITKLEDDSGNESDFLSLFFGVFVKPFMSYSIVKVDENGNYISQVVNKNPALKEAVKGITTLYKIGEHPMFKSNGAVNKETFKLFSEAMKELANLDLEKDKAKIAHNLGFMYNTLGFSITDDVVSQILDLDTYKTLTTQFGYIHKSLYDNLNISNPKDYEPLKFRGKGSFLGTLNNVLKPITDTLEDTAVSAFYDNGNMYQSYVIPSYMTKLMSKFHLDGEKFDLFITNEYGKYDWFKEHNSRDIERGWKLPILRELVTNPKAREVFDHKVLLTFNKHQYMKKMDDTEVTLAILAEYWAETTRSTLGSNRILAWFRVPMLSNKPSAEYIKFYSERGINYQDVITDNVYKIFLQEMSRILTVMMRNYGKQDPEFIKNFDKNGKKFNFVDFMNEYLTGDSKNSLLGKLILSKLNGLKLSPLEELAFSDLAKKAINDALTEKAESIVNNFERKGIFEGAKKIEGIDKDNIREELINFVWNDTYMSMSILQLTITDIAYYKDAEDLQKRLALIHAPGIRANLYATDYQGNPVSDGKLRTIYLKDFDSFISNIVDNVSVVFDRKIKNAKTEEEKLGYTILKESIVELFKNINVADAQGYSSPTSYRKKALLFGKWSKEAEDIYRKLISGEYTYSDLKTAFLPLKPFVYTLIEKSSNVNSDEAPMTNLKVGVLNKNSEYLLIMADALLLGEDTGKPNLLRALYSVMEESSIDVKETTLNNGKKQRVRTPRIDGLDTVLFESTVKAGLRGAIDINQFAYDEDGERKAKKYIESLIGKNGAYNETYVDEIPVEDYCLLQEIPAHFRGHELAHGSLIRAITPSDLESTDALGNPITYNVEGRELTAELFKTEYEKTIAANIEDSIETLTKELNLSPEATLIDRNRALEKILRREILSSPRYGVDLLLACTLNEEGLFRIPKGDPIQSKRIELLLNSIIKNRVNKQEIAGGPVVQVSNFGTSRELNIKFKAKDGSLLMTRKEFEKSPLAKKVTATSLTDKFNARYGKTSKTMTYELYIEENQAGIAYFEVFAPIYLNDIFEKFQNPDGSIDMKAIEELNPDLLKMIGYRIPTEDKYSCAPLKIVGFLPREAGDTIMLPNDITLLTGSDFK